MCLEKASPFVRLLVCSLVGIVFGIIFGLLFGLLIGWISNHFATFPLFGGGPEQAAEYSIPAFLGMGFGAIIGAILGGLQANKR